MLSRSFSPVAIIGSGLPESMSATMFSTHLKLGWESMSIATGSGV
jgi:hypothetical protein